MDMDMDMDIAVDSLDSLDGLITLNENTTCKCILYLYQFDAFTKSFQFN